MTTTSDASRFRVERAGPFRVIKDGTGGFMVVAGVNFGAVFAWLHREGFFVDSNDKTSGEWAEVCRDGVLFATEAEARFRLLLFQNPREALSAFYKGTSGEYQGTCESCLGIGKGIPLYGNAAGYGYSCPTCHGTGGPPSAETMRVAADWYGEREGFEVEELVLRQLAQGAKL